MGQTGVSSKEAAAIWAKRFRGESGCLIRKVGFTEELKSNAEAIEPVCGREKIALRGHAAQDQIWVWMFLR
jgi:hypothetical protein